MRDVLINAIAGTTAGACSTVIFYPIDTIRTRWQAADGSADRAIRGQRSFSSVARTLSVITRAEGYRALYKGCTIAICGSAIAWGFYFGVYSYLQQVTTAKGWLPTAANGLAASIATSAALHPVWMIKTHLQVDSSLTVPTAVRNVIASKGVAGLWVGLAPQLLLSIHGGIQIASYETAKTALHRFPFFVQKPTDLGADGTSAYSPSPSAPTTPSAIAARSASTAAASPPVPSTVVPSSASSTPAPSAPPPGEASEGSVVHPPSRSAVTTSSPDAIHTHSDPSASTTSAASTSSPPPSTTTSSIGKATALSTLGVVVASAIGKACAATATNPLLLVKTRMQDPRGFTSQQSAASSTAKASATVGGITSTGGAAGGSSASAGGASASTVPTSTSSSPSSSPYSTLRGSVSYIYKRDGLKGFFRGVKPQLLRVIPSACVTFVVYEKVKAALLAA